MAQFPAVIELSDLDGTNGFQISGEAAGDYSGRTVASAGDVNGDGFDDVIVGAPRADPNGSYSGASYVVFGKASGFAADIDLSSLDGTSGFQISGEAAFYDSGFSVASAGDVNGDGFADLIVGAPRANQSYTYDFENEVFHYYNDGASYVIFGKAGGFAADFDPSTLDGSNGFKIAGLFDEHSGFSVASAGDVNGDGFDDVIVAARYVVFGKADGFAATIDEASLDGTNGFAISGGALATASAGDVNGDGFDDVIVGAPYADPQGTRSGASYVVFGKASGFAVYIDLSSLDGSNGFQINGEAAFYDSGRSVASAGDVNGDGFADVIVGAPIASPHGNWSGASYVVFGKVGGFAAAVELSNLDGTNGFQISGEAAGDGSGFSVASAGDFNGDGFADLIIGALAANPHGTQSGASYVVFGKAMGFGANVDLSGLDGTNGFKLNGEAAADSSGRSVASAGDVDGDGFDDLIIGAYRADPNGTNSGASYVIFGGVPLVLAGTDRGETIRGGHFDDTLSGLGGSDRLYGGGCDDTLDGGLGNDRLDGGAGSDTATFAASAAAVTVDLSLVGSQDIGGAGIDKLIGIENLAGSGFADVLRGDGGVNGLDGGAGSDRLYGAAGDDALIGGLGNDRLDGGLGKDRLDGGEGNDRLIGGDEADTLKGNSGDDILTGGKGFDRLTGGADSDTFVFKSAAEIGLSAGGRDAIVDFVHRTDHIDLAAIDADTGAAGDQAFSFIGTADFSGTAGELRYARTDAGVTLIAGDINGDGVTDFRLELSGLLALNADDFVL